MAAPAHIARANGMLGGRPKGSVSKETKLRLKQQEAFNMKASKLASKILDAQAVSALGTYHVIELIRDPKNPQIILERHIVRDLKRQEELLTKFEYGEDFVIVEGTPPDFRAGDAILNRAWGKPKETVEHTGDVKFSLVGLAESRKVLDGNADVTVLDQPARTLAEPE